ncbi:MAG: hypothetical protein GY801_25315 [bacterium]|nr:hypothetical protein [bacterium]
MFLASVLVELLLAVILVIIVSIGVGMIIGLDPIVSIVSGFLLVALVIVVMYSFPDPEKTFKSAVSTPVPRSVEILHAKSVGIFDQTVWLHFTIRPEDLQQILSVQACTSTLYGRDRNRKNPSWWKLGQLGESTRIYRCVGNNWGKSLYVNAASTEVYHFAHQKFRAD